jgi:hypothetical protein
MADDESGTVATARAQVDKVRRRIRAAVASGRAYEAKDSARKLFLSHAAKVLACHEALVSRSRYERRSLPSLETLVSRIGDFNDHDPQVRIIRLSKGDGRFRETFDYTVLDRARQNWVKLSFELLARSHPNQSGVAGSGPAAIMHRVRDAVASGIYRYAAELDIKNCFQSIQNMDVIREAWGLPAWAIQQIVTLRGKEERGRIIDRQGRALKSSSSSSTNMLTTRGLPQGSSVSPLFAYSLNRPVLEALEREHGHEAVVFNHCDNFLVLGTTREAVERTHRTLTTLLAEHPVGPLALHTKTAPTPVGRGITFLGYRIARRAGCPIIAIAAERKVRFIREVRATLRLAKEASTAPMRRLHLEDVDHKVTGWLSAYSAAPNDLHTIVRAVGGMLMPWRDSRPIAQTLFQLTRKDPSMEHMNDNSIAAPDRPLPSRTPPMADQMMTVPAGFSVRRANVNFWRIWATRDKNGASRTSARSG